MLENQVAIVLVNGACRAILSIGNNLAQFSVMVVSIKTISEIAINLSEEQMLFNITKLGLVNGTSIEYFPNKIRKIGSEILIPNNLFVTVK